MNLEQLIFTWNGRQLVLTLFASLILYESSFMSKKNYRSNFMLQVIFTYRKHKNLYKVW